MQTSKIKVFSTYDTLHQTWNVMDMNNQCLFYGSIDDLEEWLDSNKTHYEEELNYN